MEEEGDGVRHSQPEGAGDELCGRGVLGGFVFYLLSMVVRLDDHHVCMGYG